MMKLRQLFSSRLTTEVVDDVLDLFDIRNELVLVITQDVLIADADAHILL